MTWRSEREPQQVRGTEFTNAQLLPHHKQWPSTRAVNISVELWYRDWRLASMIGRENDQFQIEKSGDRRPTRKDTSRVWLDAY